MAANKDSLSFILEDLSRIGSNLDIEPIFIYLLRLSFVKNRTEYSLITNKILETEDPEISEVLEFNLSKCLLFAEIEYADEKITYEEFDKVRGYINKLLEHVNLASQQKNYINQTNSKVEEKSRILEKQLEQLSQISSTLDTTVENISKEMVKIEKETKAVNDIKSKIYTEFVAILGIFTSIVIGFIGNFQTIGNVFTNINKVSTGKLLTFASLTALAFIVVLFLLMKWVSSIVSRNFQETHKYRSLTEIMKDNAIFIISAMILSYTFILGSVMYYDGLQKLLKGMFNSQAWTGIVIFVIPIIIITVSVVLLRPNKEKKDVS